MRRVIAQANVLDPMACKGQAQDERGGHADWHARRARKDGAISAAGPSVEVLVHAARLRPGKVLVPQVAVEFQRHLGHVQPALRDDKAEWIAQWEGSQHHIARRVREEGQSVMQVNAAERVWQCARRGVNRSIACERVRGSNRRRTEDWQASHGDWQRRRREIGGSVPVHAHRAKCIRRDMVLRQLLVPSTAQHLLCPRGSCGRQRLTRRLQPQRRRAVRRITVSDRALLLCELLRKRVVRGRPLQWRHRLIADASASPSKPRHDSASNKQCISASDTAQAHSESDDVARLPLPCPLLGVRERRDGGSARAASEPFDGRSPLRARRPACAAASPLQR